MASRDYTIVKEGDWWIARAPDGGQLAKSTKRAEVVAELNKIFDKEDGKS